MDKSKGSLIIKFAGKESLNLNILTKLCTSLTNVLNKLSLSINNVKNEYSVSYNSGEGFSLCFNQENISLDGIGSTYNIFDLFLDIMEIRKFICKTNTFSVECNEEECIINNTLDTDSFNLTSYNLYSCDNFIEDNLSKLSTTIFSQRNSVQLIYKNGILERRVSYSKEDLENTSKKINLEELTYNKEEYSSLMALEVEQLDLMSNGNWKFKDVSNKSNSFKAKIKDKEFIKDLKSGNVIIGYGLILKSEVKAIIIKDQTGRVLPNKSTYVIEKVHDVLYENQVDATTLAID